jgi:hypothetical protein
MKLKILAAALALAASGSAMAAGTCSNTDVLIGSTNATDCLGYYVGNLNNASDFAAVSADILAAWAGQGVTLGSGIIDQIATGSSASFGALAGDVVVGVHWGGGTGGGHTGFYFFNDLAATSAVVDPVDTNPALDSGGLSNVALYATGQTPPIPEPSAYALALVGFGVLGAVARRRKAK